MRAQYGLVAAITLLVVVPPQGAAPRRLGAPTAKLEQEFTGIDALRELKDGRLIVIDARDKAIHLIDLKANTDKRLGREGDGPGEFRLVQRLYNLGGDSLAMSDMARGGKLTVITPAGEIGGLLSMLDSAFSTRSFAPQTSDNAGRLYAVETKNPFIDSTAIVRWDRTRARRDTVAKLMTTPVSPLYKGPPEVRQLSIGGGTSYSYRPGPILPFATSNQWAVAGDGRIAIVEAQPYRVTLIGLSGTRVQGPVIPVAVVTVTDAEKAAFLRDLDRPSAGVSYAGRGQPATYGFIRRAMPPDLLPKEWPPSLPAFGREALVFASDGMLWVKRSTKAGAPHLYDCFDGAAKLTYQLELPPKTKVVGFGSGSVYLARVDDDDLHYLERYALPATRPIRP